MRVEEGKVRAPETGRVWLNSPDLSLGQLRGPLMLVDFWDYARINCIRTLSCCVDLSRAAAASMVESR